MSEIVWVSLNPDNCKLDLYPIDISEKLESAFWHFKSECNLGREYKNAVVKFHFGIQYQLAPINTISDSSYNSFENEPLEYRSVQRCLVKDKRIMVYIKKNGDDWRLTSEQSESIKSHTKFISANEILHIKS